MWLKLILYMGVLLITMEYAHRGYFRVYRGLQRSNYPTGLKSVAVCVTTSIPIIATLLVTGFFCVYVDHISILKIGLTTTDRCFIDVLRGIGVALIGVTTMFILGWHLGWFHIHPSSVAKSDDSFPVFSGGMADLFSGSVFEELVMRGYVFLVLQNNLGGEKAILISAVLFAAIHWIKHPKLPAIFAINGTLFGIIAGHFRMVTGLLWVPIGLHFGWNMAMGSFFGMPCAGRSYEYGLVTCAVDGPTWITGGMESPDSGMLGTFGMLVMAAITIVVFPF